MTITRRKLLAGALAAPVAAVAGVAAAAAGASTRPDPAPVAHLPRWDTATDQQVISAVTAMIGGFGAQPNALLLPMQALYRLNRPMGADAHQSVLQYIMKNNPYTAATGLPIKPYLRRV